MSEAAGRCSCCFHTSWIQTWIWCSCNAARRGLTWSTSGQICFLLFGCRYLQLASHLLRCRSDTRCSHSAQTTAAKIFYQRLRDLQIRQPSRMEPRLWSVQQDLSVQGHGSRSVWSQTRVSHTGDRVSRWPRSANGSASVLCSPSCSPRFRQMQQKKPK